MSSLSVQRSTSLNERKLPSNTYRDKLSGDVNMNDLIDENGFIKLKVVLPNQQVHVIEIHHGTPMMDLLVQVSSRCRLRPGEHMLVAVSEETGRPIEYQSSQTIGSLGVSRIHLVSKTMQKKQKEREIQKQKDASKFEHTIRVTINLPRGVKSLQRLNPDTPLLDIYKRICIDRGYDVSKYEVRITKQPHKSVDMSRSLNDYEANEITIKHCSAPDFHSSMVDINRGTNSLELPPYVSTKGATKMADPVDKVRKKKGIFSFLKKDKKTSRPKKEASDDANIPKAWKRIDDNRSLSVQALPVQGDIMMPKKPQAQVKPQPKVQATIREETEDDVINEKSKKAPSKKKYKAPAPPSRPLSTIVTATEEKTAPMYASTPNLVTSATNTSSKKSRRHPLDLHSHSRNSSDSSGYHEPPLTPPDSTSSPSTDNSLPKSSKHSTTSSGKKTPISVHRSQTLPPSSNLVNNKKGKKKAPAPPRPDKTRQAPSSPVVCNKIVESEEDTASLSSQNDTTPEMGILSSATKNFIPPIFIPPPPPQSPPPAMSESRKESQPFGRDSPESVHREFTKTPTELSAPQHNRSESRCSRASVNTIDDVQLYFDLAIAAGEKQLQNEQGSPISTNGEVSKLTDKLEPLTTGLKISTNLDKTPQEPSESDIKDAMDQIDMSIGDDDGSDSSLVPDGNKFVIASQENKMAIGGSIRSVSSTISQTGYVKPVEEISYGFENPFRGSVPSVQIDDTPTEQGLASNELLKRRDSQISDSTLPDSEHTDRPQSSSGLQSDDDESVTETGDGYDTTGTEKISQSETENSLGDATDEPFNTNQFIPKTDKRGLFVEVKGHDINRAIYGDTNAGSIRGVPGQVDTYTKEVKNRTASFLYDQPEGTIKPENSPKSILNLLTTQRVTSDAPKRSTAYSAVQLEAASTPKTSTASKLPSSNTKIDTSATDSVEPPDMSSKLYSTPLPVYSRMNRSDKTGSKAKTQENADSTTVSPVSEQAKPLASVISDSVKSGEAGKTMKKLPEPSNTLFFKAGRSSRVETTTSPSRIENIVKLDNRHDSNNVNLAYSSLPRHSNRDKNNLVQPASLDKRSATLSRKESLKEQYNKLQENMTKWQSKLKDNETRVKELTTSQQNLSTYPKHSEDTMHKPSMPKSTSISNGLSKKPLNYKDKPMYQSAPTELHKISLKPAAERVIKRLEPTLDPVEKLMKAIRDRGGRTSDMAPDRGIYVADGKRELYVVDDDVAVREIAPTVLSSANNAIPPPPPLTVNVGQSQPTRSIKQRYVSHEKPTNGTKSSDSRFNPAPSMRDNLLAEITSAKGKPTNSLSRRRNIDSSSSQSSSDELREIEMKYKPSRATKNKGKRSVSDPFPPQGPNSRPHIQPTPTELDPREELMIAIRNSGGLNGLRKVNEDEIKWSAQV